MKKLFVTRELPEEVIDYMNKYFEVKINMEDRLLIKDEIIEGTKWADAVLCTLADKIDREILTCNPNLKCVSNYAVGYNNIDVKEATELGIAVCNTPDVLTEATADIAWCLLLAVARKIVLSDTYTREGKFKGWKPTLFCGQEISGKTLGVIGAGRIGKAVARRASGFNMKVIYSNRSKTTIDGIIAKQVEFYDLLEQSDFISLNLPYTKETHHLISKNEFKIMKNSAIVINTARGACIDEESLLDALKNGEIAGAGLDVYEHEPEICSGLIALDNVVLLPHIGSATTETRNNMGFMAVDNARDAIYGKMPKAIINPEVMNKYR